MKKINSLVFISKDRIMIYVQKEKNAEKIVNELKKFGLEVEIKLNSMCG